jgi:hypothetical protein
MLIEPGNDIRFSRLVVLNARSFGVTRARRYAGYGAFRRV